MSVIVCCPSPVLGNGHGLAWWAAPCARSVSALPVLYRAAPAWIRVFFPRTSLGMSPDVQRWAGGLSGHQVASALNIRWTSTQDARQLPGRHVL
ncbi:hypothetical protein CALCODRAFT_502427 [Calocera cornea HHB12733]|uniref:Uncharacterized protein n=1 Tax=Calocera cornea HHB12733 TaxID=1353952 RepID=A0A165D9U4_9BASI|nr:hypothetical protein CALCODRAFT_502427 [Calocera cornea HHB12733]